MLEYIKHKKRLYGGYLYKHKCWIFKIIKHLYEDNQTNFLKFYVANQNIYIIDHTSVILDTLFLSLLLVVKLIFYI